MTPAPAEAVAASLRAMGFPPCHADALVRGRPLVSVSPSLARTAITRGRHKQLHRRRAAPVPLPKEVCRWSSSDRALIVEALAVGQITIEAVCQRYGVDRLDVSEWVRACVNASQDHQKAARRGRG